MLGRKSRPMIGKIITGDRSGQPDFSTSPKSPLEFKIWSPRNLINYDTKKVGLGILADLGESSENFAGKLFSGRNFNRSDPIPVKKIAEPKKDFEEIEMDSLEDYTFVTCHGPKKSYTKVYGRNGEERENVERERFLGGEIRKRVCLFNISPIRFGDFPANPTSDFLSSCCLCKKKLHGKDIFMYRGEKAFCSTECRYRQITIDERKEKCRSEASRSVDVSNSPCTNQGSFLTGILAI